MRPVVEWQGRRAAPGEGAFLLIPAGSPPLPFPHHFSLSSLHTRGGFDAQAR